MDEKVNAQDMRENLVNENFKRYKSTVDAKCKCKGTGTKTAQMRTFEIVDCVCMPCLLFMDFLRSVVWQREDEFID